VSTFKLLDLGGGLQTILNRPSPAIDDHQTIGGDKAAPVC
jgi:hypothetical protein